MEYLLYISLLLTGWDIKAKECNSAIFILLPPQWGSILFNGAALQENILRRNFFISISVCPIAERVSRSNQEVTERFLILYLLRKPEGVPNYVAPAYSAPTHIPSRVKYYSPFQGSTSAVTLL